MKIESSLPLQQTTFNRADVTRETPAHDFSEHILSKDTPESTSSFRSDKATFSTKGLAVSTSLANASGAAPSLGTINSKASSSVISSQSEPYLSADEVSFFEKMMRKASNYTNTGGYAQSIQDTGSSFAFKI